VSRPFVLVAAGLIVMLVAAVALAQWLLLAVDDVNFSQYRGFAAYFAANPPRATLPSPDERALLVKYAPRFFLPPGHAGPISFYDDYIASGSLRSGDGRLVSERVTQSVLNANKTDSKAVFTHHPRKSGAARPVVFGRIDRDTLSYAGRRQRLTFLTYHAVFRTSGLPAGLSWWQETLAGLVADPADWHQLDHYTAATVVLDELNQPVALMLQQHNYSRTYLFDETVVLPPDGRVAIDVAIRSNELYPHKSGRTLRRAARFPDPPSMRYLMGVGSRPLFAGDDVTEPVCEADYQLRMLAPDDAFYTFRGFLGARRRLPGRDGPPGADFNQLPALKPQVLRMLAGYWRSNNRGDVDRY